MAIPLLELLKRTIDKYDDHLYARELRVIRGDSKGIKSDTNEMMDKLNAREIHLTENIKGKFEINYLVRGSYDIGTYIIKTRDCTEEEIVFLKKQCPDEFEDEANAFFYLIREKYFEKLKLLNEEMIDLRTGHYIRLIIRYLKMKKIDLKTFEKLLEIIENYYKPDGDGMKNAKERYSDLVGPEETKD